MATLIVNSQEELDDIIKVGGNIQEKDLDVILIHRGYTTEIKKGPFTKEE